MSTSGGLEHEHAISSFPLASVGRKSQAIFDSFSTGCHVAQAEHKLIVQLKTILNF